MATIKKITAKTIFLITAIIGLGTFSAFLWKIFFGNSEVNLTKLGSATGKDTFAPVARADIPSTTTSSEGPLTTDTTGSSGGTTGAGGSADGSAGG